MPGSIDASHNAHSTRDKLVALTQLHDRRTNTYTCKSTWQRRHLPPSPAHVRAHLITHDARAWRHCASWRAAQAPIHRVQNTAALSEASRQLFETTRRHRCCCSPQAAPGDMCSGHMPRKSLQHWDPCHNHQNNHAACQQCSCERVQTEATKVPFSRREWQAGRAGGRRAYRRVHRVRKVQDCRARGLSS